MPNLYCMWRFNSAQGEAVRIKFKSFDVEDDPSGKCDFDYVEIHDEEVCFGIYVTFSHTCINL